MNVTMEEDIAGQMMEPDGAEAMLMMCTELLQQVDRV